MVKIFVTRIKREVLGVPSSCNVHQYNSADNARHAGGRAERADHSLGVECLPPVLPNCIEEADVNVRHRLWIYLILRIRLIIMLFVIIVIVKKKSSKN